MIIGVGIDIIEIDRVARLVEGEPFPEKIYSEEEVRACRAEGLEGRRRTSRFAGLFAAKEAVMKALGTGWADGVAWADISITPDPRGKPEAALKGKTAQIAAGRGVKRIHLSIAHDQTHAVAHALLEG
jgi:holo-[acyl-carrier protein] synthase